MYRTTNIGFQFLFLSKSNIPIFLQIRTKFSTQNIVTFAEAVQAINTSYKRLAELEMVI